jgi:hypothetical protein
MMMSTMATTTTTTMMAPKEAIVQTEPPSGDNTADLAISILRMEKGSYMPRLPLGVTLMFDCRQ